jgi:hypothetical protein
MSGIARRRYHSVTYHNPEKAYKGYTYFAPFWEQSRAFLIDMEGRFVNYWQLPGRAGEITFMLENGNILYPSRVSQGESSPLFPGFCGGDTIEMDWDNNIVWKHTDDRQHHTIQRLSNGNTVICDSWSGRIFEVNREGELVWEYISPFRGSIVGMDTTMMWRAHRYLADYPGFKGRDLDPKQFPLENRLFGPESFRTDFTPYVV